ncbi:MAG: T9SS type A sorting domain-containing protein, partial [Ignavibacteria bacterium]
LLMVNDSTILSGSLGDGLFISTDKGFTWNNKILYENIYCLLSYNSVIYAGTSSGIYFSSDSGLSWNNLGMTNKAIYCIEIKNNLMLASTNKEILRSTNSGCNWEQFLPNELINKINDITINDAGKIFIASDIGIFSSIDLGETWISQNQGVESINNFFSILAFDNHIFVGTFDGIYASSDNGINWEYRSKGIYQKIVYSIIKKGHDLFAGTINGLFKSIDLGVSWIVCELDTFWVRGLATDSYDNIFAGTNNGIFKSTDDGDSWTNITSFNAGGFNSFIVLPNNYIFTGNHYSTNSGDSWYEINILNASTITNYKNELYAGTDMSGVYYSSDLGNTWESRGLNNLEIFSLSVNNDTVLVGINNAGNDPNPVGPYISFNKGSTWNDVGEGMENKSVLSFEFDEKGYLLAGTRTCLYRSKNILTSFLEGQVRKTETKYILSQNYPNPFNPVTRIRYQLPERTFVSIKVYDNLGKEIALLVNEEKTAGEYSIEFDGSEFSSGVYFYSIAAGDFREVRKIILMK